MLSGRLAAALDRRLTPGLDRPVAVALSGGGDSLALLHLTADWARSRRRRLLALTVDHRLHPASGEWTTHARQMAERAGADWRGLEWTDEKPASGLPAAARLARHALIAGAAREAGALVILMAHTADDRAEAAWMRERGSSLGELREWAPSPVWPDGRGLMVLRPLLDTSRAELRTFLSSRHETWIDDPANDNPASIRVRARQALDGASPPVLADGPLPAKGLSVEGGVVRAPANTPWLGAVLTCAAGAAGPPRADRLHALAERLASGEPVQATLAGATLVSDGRTLSAAREIGRSPAADLLLNADAVQVWDGRYAVEALEPGWIIGLAAGRRAGLSRDDRARLDRLPAIGRGSHPVLFRGDGASPVLASDGVTVRDLVADRLRLATGGAPREADLIPPAMAPNAVASYL